MGSDYCILVDSGRAGGSTEGIFAEKAVDAAGYTRANHAMTGGGQVGLLIDINRVDVIGLQKLDFYSISVKKN